MLIEEKCGKVFRNKKNGKLYEVIGYCTAPTICLQQIDGTMEPWDYERIEIVNDAPIEAEWFEAVPNYNGLKYSDQFNDDAVSDEP